MNEKVENKETSKIKSNKGLIIFLTIFSIICIGLTVGAIFYTNKQKERERIKQAEINKEKSKIEKIIPDNLGIKDYTDKYDNNDLEITPKAITRGIGKTQTYENGYTDTTYPVKIEYVQINGLKDKSIEKKINNEIEEFAINLIPSDWEKKEENIYINIACSANFSNVLCVVYNYNNEININEYNEYGQNFEALNYNLITGEKIKFNDLFTNTASIKNIISQVAYNSLILGKYRFEEGGDMNAIDYSKTQDEIFKILSSYKSNNDIKFYFRPATIYAQINNINIEISMRDFYKDIAIYNRYANKEIYDESFKNSKDLFVFVNRDIKDFYYSLLDEYNDNLYVDIVMGNTDNEDEKKVYELYKKEINKKVEDVKKYSENNKNKGIIYTAFVYVREDTDGEITLCNEINEFESTKEYYKSDLLNEVLDKIQRGNIHSGGIGTTYYIDSNIIEKLDEYKSKSINRTYNLNEMTYIETIHNQKTGETTKEKYDAKTGKKMVINEVNN